MTKLLDFRSSTNGDWYCSVIVFSTFSLTSLNPLRWNWSDFIKANLSSFLVLGFADPSVVDCNIVAERELLTCGANASTLAAAMANTAAAQNFILSLSLNQDKKNAFGNFNLDSEGRDTAERAAAPSKHQDQIFHLEDDHVRFRKLQCQFCETKAVLLAGAFLYRYTCI